MDYLYTFIHYTIEKYISEKHLDHLDKYRKQFYIEKNKSNNDHTSCYNLIQFKEIGFEETKKRIELY